MGVEDGDIIAEKGLNYVIEMMRKLPQLPGKVVRGVRDVSAFAHHAHEMVTKAKEKASCADEMDEKVGAVDVDELAEKGSLDLGGGAQAALRDGVVNITFDFSDNMVEGEDGARPIEDFAQLESDIRSELAQAGIEDITVFTIDEKGIGNLTYAQADHDKVKEGIAQCKDLCAKKVVDAEKQLAAVQAQPTCGIAQKDIDKALAQELEVSVADIEAVHGTAEYKELTGEIVDNLGREMQAQGIDAHGALQPTGAISVAVGKGQEVQASAALSAIQNKFDKLDQKRALAGDVLAAERNRVRTIAGKQVKNYEPIASRMSRARKAATDEGLQKTHRLGVAQEQGVSRKAGGNR